LKLVDHAISDKWVDRILKYQGIDKNELAQRKSYWISTLMCLIATVCITLIVWITDPNFKVLIGYGLALNSIFLDFVIAGILIPRKLYNLRFINQCAIIIITFLCILKLGGILYSGGFAIIGFFVVLFSLDFKRYRHSFALFALYIATIIAMGILDPYLTKDPGMTPGINIFLFVSTLGWLTFIAILFVFNHIKQRVKIEQLEATRLKEIDELKSRLYSNISHEFRTPLSLILGSIDQLKHSKGAENVSDNVLNTMERNGNRLYRLVNQLLELSKLDEGKMKIRLGQGNISESLNYIFSSYESISERKRIKYSIKNPENQIIAYYDPEKLEMIVHNLLSNAFKFTPEYGQIAIVFDRVAKEEISIDSINTQRKYSGALLFFSIMDTGPGIEKHHHVRIFNRFEKILGNGTQYCEGMGIGLALTKQLIDFQGGNIWVESEINKGSTFSFYLPIDKSDFTDYEIIENKQIEEPIKNKSVVFDEQLFCHIEKSNKKLSDDNQSFPIILIVEDNFDMRFFLKNNLEPFYMIELATDGEEGWIKANNSIPDLIITDLMMPKLDGLSLCLKLKNDHRTSHIPVIILTARASVENRIEGLQTGADEYLEKPFKIEELRIRIENLIIQRQKLKEKYTKMFGIYAENIEVSNIDECFLKKAIQQIEQNMEKIEWSVEEFRNSMNMSRSQLFRKIKALTGMSVTDYILSIRLNHAAYMLENNVGNITEIAFKSGFNDSSYFAKCFKKKYGVSPRSYALKYKNL
jgi:signal transduction histidine kinase/DNA-binding response OmpR family regulator